MKCFYFLLIIVILTSTEFEYSKCTSELDPNFDKCHKKWPICVNEVGGFANIACMFRNCAPRVQNCTEILPDDKFRKTVLDEHNKLRNKIASGNDKTGKNEAASNIRALSYDLGLEYTSICQVHGCSMKENYCRGTAKFNPVGQNLGLKEFVGSPRLTDKQIKDIKELRYVIAIINSWYAEIGLEDFSKKIDHYVHNPQTARFTQLIWAQTTHVGCARAYIIPNATHMFLHLTCHYAPAGNFKDLIMYRKGPSCRVCPYRVYCNKQYPALCGEIDNTDLIAGVNPYRAADIERGNQNSLHGSILWIFSATVFIIIRCI